MYTVCSTFKLKYTSVGTVELDSGQKLKKIQLRDRERELNTIFEKLPCYKFFKSTKHIFKKI